MVEFGFQFGTFWHESLCLFHSEICVLGREGERGGSEWSNSVLTWEAYPLTLFFWDVELDMDWAEGGGMEGWGRWGKLGVADPPLHGTDLLTLGLWKSWICRCSSDPGPVLSKASWSDSVFWNNRGRRRINPWQTLGQEMWNTCLPGVPSNVSNQWTRFHLNLLWLLWNL